MHDRQVGDRIDELVRRRGAIALTRTPYRTGSSAWTIVIAATPAFAAAWFVIPGSGLNRPPSEVVLTIARSTARPARYSLRQ